MEEKIFDLIIPTYRPGDDLRELLTRIARQSILPRHLIIINTDEREWNLSGISNTAEFGLLASITQIYHVSRRDFRHGATRNKAASYGESPLIVFMTQDALPADNVLFERLLAPIGTEYTGTNGVTHRIGMTYARQLAGKRANPIERITREFNYPDRSETKTASDIDRLGIKTYFASDVCAGYDREVFEQLGGFAGDVIFDEDMLYAAKLINSGQAVRYCADARVYHAHNYTPLQQLRRNFDNGATQAMHPEVFGGLHNESEGIRLVKATAKELIRQRRFSLIPELILQSGCKYTGFRLGRIYYALPRAWLSGLSTNKEYWKR